MEHDQFTFSNTLDIMGELPGETAVENLLRLFVPESLDHTRDNNRSRYYRQGVLMLVVGLQCLLPTEVAAS